MKLTVDASIVAKWFLTEPQSEEACQLLAPRIRLHAPDEVVDCLYLTCAEATTSALITADHARQTVLAVRRVAPAGSHLSQDRLGGGGEGGQVLEEALLRQWIAARADRASDVNVT